MTQWQNDFRFTVNVNIKTIIQTPPVAVHKQLQILPKKYQFYEIKSSLPQNT